MAGRNVQAIPVHGPIPLPLYEFGDEDLPEGESGETVSVYPYEKRPLHLCFGAGGTDSALLDEEDVRDLIAYCKLWLRALKIHKAAVAEAAKAIKAIGEKQL